MLPQPTSQQPQPTVGATSSTAVNNNTTSTTTTTTTTTGTRARTASRIKDLGKWELFTDSKLGFGSFATVYLGHTKGSEPPQHVAIKTIKTEKLKNKVLKNMELEAQTLLGTNHPNIVRLYGIKRSSGHIFLIFEYCKGGDMSIFLRKHGKLSEPIARHFLLQLASGLLYLHERNLIHRDLKPQNLLLTSENETAQLKIADFGFVKEIDEQDLTDTLCGTPLYMAPEMMRSQPYNSKVDLWSVGTILYELLMGKHPYGNPKSAFDLLNSIEKTQPRMPTNVSPECVDLLHGLLQKDPEQRLSYEQFFKHPYINLSSAPNVPPTVSDPTSTTATTSTTTTITAAAAVSTPADGGSSLHTPMPPGTAAPQKQSNTPVNIGGSGAEAVLRAENEPMQPTSGSMLSISDHRTAVRQPKVNPFKSDLQTSNSPVEVAHTQPTLPAALPNIPQSSSTITPTTATKNLPPPLTSATDSGSSSEGDFVVISKTEQLHLSHEALSFTGELNLDYLGSRTDLGHINYPLKVFDFSQASTEPCTREQVATIVSAEDTMQLAWYVVESAQLRASDDPSGAVALDVLALDLLHSAVTRIRSIKAQCERITLIEQWLQQCFSQVLDITESLRLSAEQQQHTFASPPSTTSVLDVIPVEQRLYEYALQLGREAAMAEFLDNVFDCEAMYTRALAILQYLATSTQDVSDHETLLTCARSIRQRLDAQRHKLLPPV